jgi:anti-anti-sigma factor
MAVTASNAELAARESVAQTESLHPGEADTAVMPRHPEHPVIALPGEIDICIHGQVEASVSLALSDGATVLIADGSRTTFCDCSGVHALVRAHRQAVAAGVQLRIAASPAIWRILQLTGADRVLDTYSTVFEALAGR